MCPRLHGPPMCVLHVNVWMYHVRKGHFIHVCVGSYVDCCKPKTRIHAGAHNTHVHMGDRWHGRNVNTYMREQRHTFTHAQCASMYTQMYMYEFVHQNVCVHLQPAPCSLCTAHKHATRRLWYSALVNSACRDFALYVSLSPPLSGQLAWTLGAGACPLEKSAMSVRCHIKVLADGEDDLGAPRLR